MNNHIFQNLEPPIGGLTKLKAKIDELEQYKRNKRLVLRIAIPLATIGLSIMILTINRQPSPYEQIIKHAGDDLILYQLGEKDPTDLPSFD